MKKVKKGEFGYVDSQTKKEVLKTIIYFGISLALFLIGYITTGSEKNWLTVVAVLGCLPSSKCAVNMIMFLKSKGCSTEVYEKIIPHGDSLLLLYDLFLTTYDKNFKIDSMMIYGDTICGYSESAKCDDVAAAKHIQSILGQNGYKHCNVKIFKELPKYLERLDSIRQLEKPEENHELEMAAVILAISI